MKITLVKVLALGAALAASATFARADSVSVTGPSIYSNGSIYFPTTNTYAINGTSTGAFSMFTAGQTVDWYLAGQNIPLGTESSGPNSLVYNSPGPNGLPVFTVTEGGSTLSFTLTQEAWYATDYAGVAEVTVDGNGYFDLNGTDSNATFVFTINQDDGSVSGSFSGTGITATPEPSSLALLGTGLLGAAAVARRRFMARLS